MKELQDALSQISELIDKIEIEKNTVNDSLDLALLIGKQGGLIDAKSIIIKLMDKL